MHSSTSVTMVLWGHAFVAWFTGRKDEGVGVEADHQRQDGFCPLSVAHRPALPRGGEVDAHQLDSGPLLLVDYL
jgi:hypothetical protein